MNWGLWLLLFEKDPSRCRGCREGLTLFQSLISTRLSSRSANGDAVVDDIHNGGAGVTVEYELNDRYLRLRAGGVGIGIKKTAAEDPGIRGVPEHAAKEVAPGHRVKLELCQFDRFTKDLFHDVTPFSVHERSRCRTLSPAEAPS